MLPPSPERVCLQCGDLIPVDELARDASRLGGRKSICKRCEAAKSKAYYWANRETILEKAAAKRGRARPPELTACTECGGALTGRQRVVCGQTCRERRFKRLHPEAYAERERQKVERRRAKRQEARKS